MVAGLPQCSDNRPQAHLLGKPLRCPHLLVVERGDQRTCRDRESLHSCAIEHNRHDAIADPPHKAGRFILRLLFACKIAQCCLDRSPMMFLGGGQFEHALYARDID